MKRAFHRWWVLPAAAIFFCGGALRAHAALAVMRNIDVGRKLIPFSLADAAGAPFDIASLAGKPAVIIFWTTWSPRSTDILQDFKKYHQEYGPRGLAVVAINVDGENLSADRKQAVRDFLSRMDLPFTVLLDEKLTAMSAYGVMAYPSALVADTGGTVTYLLGGYPLSLRGELKDNMLKVLGLYVPPPKEAPPAVGYVPKGGALQFFNMGRQLMDLGQTDKAIDYFRRAAERDPAFMEPTIMMSRILMVQGDLAAAEAEIRKVGVDSINRNDVRFLLGYLMLAKDKPAGAEALFRPISEKSPGEGWGWWGMGLAALAKGDMPAALELMEKAKSIQPKLFEAEAYAHEYARKRWLRGENIPDEARLISLFPSLTEARERYRKLRGAGGQNPPP